MHFCASLCSLCMTKWWASKYFRCHQHIPFPISDSSRHHRMGELGPHFPWKHGRFRHHSGLDFGHGCCDIDRKLICLHFFSPSDSKEFIHQLKCQFSKFLKPKQSNFLLLHRPTSVRQNDEISTIYAYFKKWHHNWSPVLWLVERSVIRWSKFRRIIVCSYAGAIEGTWMV